MVAYRNNSRLVESDINRWCAPTGPLTWSRLNKNSTLAGELPTVVVVTIDSNRLPQTRSNYILVAKALPQTISTIDQRPLEHYLFYDHIHMSAFFKRAYYYSYRNVSSLVFRRKTYFYHCRSVGVIISGSWRIVIVVATVVVVTDLYNVLSFSSDKQTLILFF